MADPVLVAHQVEGLGLGQVEVEDPGKMEVEDLGQVEVQVVPVVEVRWVQVEELVDHLVEVDRQSSLVVTSSNI